MNGFYRGPALEISFGIPADARAALGFHQVDIVDQPERVLIMPRSFRHDHIDRITRLDLEGGLEFHLAMMYVPSSFDTVATAVQGGVDAVSLSSSVCDGTLDREDA